MKGLQCQSCGLYILPGASFYLCRTEIISGYDGFLPELPDTANPDQMIDSALKKLGGKSEQELMDDVYQEIKVVLCPVCRLKLRDRILGMLRKK